MSKKLKPIKLSPNKYSFRGYIIKSYGSYDHKESIVWKAVNEETEELEFTSSSLHEIVNLINEKLS